MTGRDQHDAGQLPWSVFRGAAWLLVCLWFVGAAWALAMACGVRDLPTSVLPQEVALSDTPTGGRLGGKPGYLDFNPNELEHLEPLAQVPVDWPSENFQPWGLSCDSTGRHFALTDEFQMYSGTLEYTETGSRLAKVTPTPSCLPMEGQSLRDIVVECEQQEILEEVYMGSVPKRPPCKALVLHDGGARVAVCELFRGSTEIPSDPKKELPSGVELHASVGNGAAHSGDAWNVSTKWLRTGAPNGREEVISASIDSRCESSSGADGESDSKLCGMVVGTNQGRIVRLRRHIDGSRELVPESVVWNELGSRATADMLVEEVWATSSLQAILGGILLALKHQREILYAIHMPTHRILGRWRLPKTPGRVWTSLAGGGTHIFIASQDEGGTSAELWRFALPHALRQFPFGAGALPLETLDDRQRIST